MPSINGSKNTQEQKNVNQANRPVSASGKPSGDAVPVRRPASAASAGRKRDLKSEYERSFAPFDQYLYRNGKWTTVRAVSDNKITRPWLEELLDSRKRAQENKSRSRGDHFSRDHMLQINSDVTGMWEAPCFIGSSMSQHASSNKNIRVRDVEFPDRHWQQSGDSAGVVALRNLSGEEIRALLVPEPVSVSRSISQCTQTLPDIAQASREFTGSRPPKVRGDAIQSDFNQPDTETPHDRIQIMRKAKYYDGKDPYILSLAPPIPRSSSMTIPRSSGSRSGSPSAALRGSSSFVRSRTGSISSKAGDHGSFYPKTNGSTVIKAENAKRNNVYDNQHNASSLRATDVESLAASAFSVSPPRRNGSHPSGSDGASKAKKDSLSWTVLAGEPKKLGQSRFGKSAVNSRSQCLRATEAVKVSKSHAWTEL